MGQNPRSARAQVRCYNCGRQGHIASNCPNRTNAPRGGAQAVRGRARRGQPGRTILTLALGSGVEVDVQGSQDTTEATSASAVEQGQQTDPQPEN